MVFKVKSKGRPKVNYKLRSFNAFAPKGFKFHSISRKNKAVKYKKI